ncbi:MAG: phenylalanine--tRNA ligase subunit beta, partial [Chloroflexi bacterium]|nr:phenylalanine--tRNA ligase subunit beta [Chloroflexota bacterium]
LLEKWGAPHSTVPISVHPPVYEDLAIVVDADTPAAIVQRLIIETGGPLARSAILFDVYRGEQISEDKKSLAFRLTYQADDCTLTDKTVAKVRQKIIRRLEKELGAALRQ